MHGQRLAADRAGVKWDGAKLAGVKWAGPLPGPLPNPVAWCPARFDIWRASVSKKKSIIIAVAVVFVAFFVFLATMGPFGATAVSGSGEGAGMNSGSGSSAGAGGAGGAGGSDAQSGHSSGSMVESGPGATMEGVQASGLDYTVFELQGTGSAYAPSTFQMNGGASTEGIPNKWLYLSDGETLMYMVRYDQDSYAVSGAQMPQSLEEFAARESTKSLIPADKEFSEDQYGSLACSFTQTDESGDTMDVYLVLLAGPSSFGYMAVYTPQDSGFDSALWASSATLA